MPRLIDLDKINPLDFPSTEMDGLDVVRYLNTLPTVDAVAVVRGRWEEWWPPAHTIMTGEEMLYRCSACDAKYANVEGFRYCPRCGANMI